MFRNLLEVIKWHELLHFLPGKNDLYFSSAFLQQDETWVSCPNHPPVTKETPPEFEIVLPGSIRFLMKNHYFYLEFSKKFDSKNSESLTKNKTLRDLVRAVIDPLRAVLGA